MATILLPSAGELINLYYDLEDQYYMEVASGDTIELLREIVDLHNMIKFLYPCVAFTARAV
jgi:hypothetical protein